jgi:hypothetical protein
MSNTPVGAGASAVGAPAPSSTSKIRTAHLLLALLIISAPYFHVLPHGMANEARQATPHCAWSIGINVFWSQLVGAAKRVGRFVAGKFSHGFDVVLEFFVARVERLRDSRAETEQRVRHGHALQSDSADDDPGAAADTESTQCEELNQTNYQFAGDSLLSSDAEAQ